MVFFFADLKKLLLETGFYRDDGGWGNGPCVTYILSW
jgi:hypothetical protein